MLQCPIPLNDYPSIQLAHGGGGKLMHELIEKMLLSVFDNPILLQRHDAAVFTIPQNKLAMTSDSFVVRPLFFPGGDIGDLAIHGTVNDLAMSGAKPLYLSVSLIIEEGFAMESLWKIISSMKNAADRAEVSIITGDTKVVERGHGDGVFINTTGIGIIEHDLEILPKSIQIDDAIILSGDLGRHGMTIMAQREGLEFETTLTSDTCNLWSPIHALLKEGIHIHCLRDLTRGGLAASLHEIAQATNLKLLIEEKGISISSEVLGACEILGIDPLTVACEGRFILFLPFSEAPRALQILKQFTCTPSANLIGKVMDRNGKNVILNGIFGAQRMMDFPVGEQLPRIC